VGTRNLTAVYVDGQFKIAQYGQWDGYPSGQGKTILDFLRSLETLPQISEFIEKVRAAHFLTVDQLDEIWTKAGAGADGFISCDLSDKLAKKMPEIHRDTGGKILQLVYERPAGIGLQNDITFAGDPGYFGCEWAYVVDLDAGVFEAYAWEGHRSGRPGGRLANKPDGYDGEWKPVGLVASWPLEKLPTVKEFLIALSDKATV
jgi:hypothetical protein